MKSQLILAASIALVLAAPAFAQYNTQATPPASQAAPDQTAPADSPSMSSDARQPAATGPHHRMRHRQSGRHSSAAEGLTGNESGTAAYQASNRVKNYPAVDHGHVAGDPPVIDHSGDQTPVANPTAATITVPPTR